MIVDPNLFTYVYLWSEESTWGGDLPPIEGDYIVIPNYRNLLLDISPPKLKAIVIEGSLVFKDVDLHLQSEFILV